MTPALIDPDSIWAKLVVALGPLLFPALWGGIGACTFFDEEALRQAVRAFL